MTQNVLFIVECVKLVVWTGNDLQFPTSAVDIVYVDWLSGLAIVGIAQCLYPCTKKMYNLDSSLF